VPEGSDRQALRFDLLSHWLFSPLYYAVAALLGWSLTHR
jgi:hypothetical protein